MDISDVEASREVILASLGDLGEHAEIEITLDKMHEAEKMLKDGASYQEVSRTFGVSRKTLGNRFPGYGWTQAQGAQWRELKNALEEATLTPSNEQKARMDVLMGKTPERQTCSKGLHQWIPENIIEEKSGKRRCKPCNRDYRASRRKS